MAAETDPSDSPLEPAVDTGPLRFFFPELTDGEAAFLDHEAAVIADRRRRVMALYRRGRKMTDIVADLKAGGEKSASLTTVHRDLHAVLDGYRKLAARDAAEHIADQLQRLAHREAEVETDLERSRGEFVETSSTRRQTAAGSQDQAAVKKRSKYGDPRLHALLQGYWDRRCRLLGLFKDADFKGVNPVKLVAGLDPGEEV